MGSKNLWVGLGRLTRDPESRTFQNGGKVAQFGFAVTGERRKDPASGEWSDVPCFLDCKAFNRQNGRQLADQVMANCQKGKELLVTGHLVLEQWEKDGVKRQAIKVIVDEITYVGKKEDSPGRPGGRRPAAPVDPDFAPPDDDDGEIPF